ncbi:hypothetical protein AERO8C_120119 [Aeromonas veronii]|uniref:Uncharacterized protein n=1 Tax=Aeromonas veronii TaxID=654 RepID=A0A653KS49_AERVE|nr:hypothetical protein AERO8C_120119 [Aeromonas veronii]
MQRSVRKDLLPYLILLECFAVPAAEDQRGVDAAKGEVVGHQILDLQLSSLTRDVVEGLAGRGRVGQIEGRRKPAIVQHLKRQPGFDGATGAEGMAEIALERGDGGLLTEDGGSCLALGDIAPLGGGAVSTDIANLLGTQPCLIQCHLHAELHGLALGLGDMGRIAVGGKTDQLGDDVGAAGEGMLQLFEHQSGSSFADHQSVAIPVKRARGELGGVVELTGGKQGIEHHRLGGAELLRATCHHHCLVAVADCFVGVADPLAARGAGAGCRDDPATQAEEEAGVDRCRVRHHLHIGGGGDVGSGLVVEHGAKGADGRRAAGGGAIGDTGAAIAQHRLVQQLRLLQRQLGGHGRHLGDSSHGADLLARIVGRQGKVADRRGQPGVEPVIDTPLVHGDHGVASCLQARFDAGPVVAKGGHTGHAGDYDPSIHIRPPLMEITCRVT